MVKLPKCYKSKHDVVSAKQTHFRAWKSGKQWLYGSAILLALAGGTAGLAIEANHQANPVIAATSSTGALTSGSSTTTADYKATSYAPGTFSLNQNGGVAKSSFYQNYPMDMSQSMTFSGTIGSSTTGGGWGAIGGLMGIVLVPYGTGNGAAVNAWNPRTGAGLPNTFFFGRPDNQTVTNGGTLPGGTDTTSSYTGSSLVNNVILATTGSSTVSTIKALGVANWNTVLGASSTGDGMTITWTPSSTNATDSTVTGTFALTVNGSTTYSTTYSTTIPRNMILGATLDGITGLNQGPTSSTNAGNNNIYVAVNYKYTTAAEPVIVNYLNAKTGSSYAPNGVAMSASTITTKLADQLGVISPALTTISDANTYDYTAPSAASGYTVSSVAGITTSGATSGATIASNFDSGVSNPNIINVYYGPAAQSATFTYNWDTAKVPGASTASLATLPNSVALPTKTSTTGYTDSAIAAPTVAAPSGYNIEGYTYSSGATIYTTLTSAESAYASAASGTAGNFAGNIMNPTFGVVLQANTETNTYTASYAAGTPGTGSTAGSTAPTLSTYASTAGLTGSSVSGNPADASLAVSGYSYAVSVAGSTYTTMSSAMAANPSYATSNRAVNIIYSAISQAAAFNEVAASGTNLNFSSSNAVSSGLTGGLTSTAASNAGYTDAAISHAGYTYSVLYSNSSASTAALTSGTSYSTLASAISANPYLTSAATADNFTVVYSAMAQSATFSASYAAGTPGVSGSAGSLAMTLPTSTVTTTGSTGAGIYSAGAWNSLSAAFTAYSGYDESIVAKNSTGSSSSFAFTAAGYQSAASYAGSNGTYNGTSSFAVVYSAQAQTAVVQLTGTGTGTGIGYWNFASAAADYSGNIDSGYGRTGGLLTSATGSVTTWGSAGTWPTDAQLASSGYTYKVTDVTTGSKFSTMSSAVAADSLFDNNQATTQTFTVSYTANPVTISVAPVILGAQTTTGPWNIPTGPITAVDSEGKTQTFSVKSDGTVATGWTLDDSAVKLGVAGTYPVTYTYTDPNTGQTASKSTYVTLVNMASNNVTNNQLNVGSSAVLNNSLAITPVANLDSTSVSDIVSASASSVTYSQITDGNGNYSSGNASDATITANTDGTVNFVSSAAGKYTFTVTYTDQYGNKSTSTDTVYVWNLPDWTRPSLPANNGSVRVGTALKAYDPSTEPFFNNQDGADIFGDAGAIIYSSNPAINNVGVTVNVDTSKAGTGTLNWYHTYNDPSTNQTVQATAVSTVIVVQIPTLAAGNQTVLAGSTNSSTFSAIKSNVSGIDQDGSGFNWGKSGLTADTSQVQWNIPGTYNVTYTYSYVDAAQYIDDANGNLIANPTYGQTQTVSKVGTVTVVAPTATGKMVSTANNTFVKFANGLNMITDGSGNTSTVSAASVSNLTGPSGSTLTAGQITVDTAGNVTFPAAAINGSYTFNVNYTDNLGNTFSATDNVIVTQDGATLKPVTLNPGGSTTIFTGGSYSAQSLFNGGTDEYGNTITYGNVTVDTSKVNTAVPGIYTITYTWTDPMNGTKYTTNATVTVVAVPTITTSINQVYIYANTSQTELDSLANSLGSTAIAATNTSSNALTWSNLISAASSAGSTAYVENVNLATNATTTGEIDYYNYYNDPTNNGSLASVATSVAITQEIPTATGDLKTTTAGNPVTVENTWTAPSNVANASSDAINLTNSTISTVNLNGSAVSVAPTINADGTVTFPAKDTNENVLATGTYTFSVTYVDNYGNSNIVKDTVIVNAPTAPTANGNTAKTYYNTGTSLTNSFTGGTGGYTISAESLDASSLTYADGYDSTKTLDAATQAKLLAGMTVDGSGNVNFNTANLTLPTGKYSFTVNYTLTLSDGSTVQVPVTDNVIVYAPVTLSNLTTYQNDPTFSFPEYTDQFGNDNSPIYSTSSVVQNADGSQSLTTIVSDIYQTNKLSRIQTKLIANGTQSFTLSDGSTVTPPAGTIMYVLSYTDAVTGNMVSVAAEGSTVAPTSSNQSAQTTTFAAVNLPIGVNIPTADVGTDRIVPTGATNGSSISNISLTAPNGTTSTVTDPGISIDASGNVTFPAVAPPGTYKFTVNYVDKFGNTTSAVDTVQVNIYKATLPFTGGEGFAIVLATAGTLGLAALAISLKRRSKEEINE